MGCLQILGTSLCFVVLSLSVVGYFFHFFFVVCAPPQSLNCNDCIIGGAHSEPWGDLADR